MYSSPLVLLEYQIDPVPFTGSSLKGNHFFTVSIGKGIRNTEP
jgi:hypothetical protein